MFVQPMVLTISPLLPLRSTAFGAPTSVEVRSRGPGGHDAGATPSMMMFDLLRISVGPLQTPFTRMVWPLATTFTAAWRLGKVPATPTMLTLQVPVANSPQKPHDGSFDCPTTVHTPLAL